MPQGASDDADRFMRAITALSAEPAEVTALGRRIGDASPNEDGVLGHILTEIEETVLRRVLIFSTPQGNELALEVMERRVLCLTQCPTDLVDIYASLAERALDEADAADLANCIKHFTTGAEVIFAKSLLSPTGADPSIGGISVRALSKACRSGGCTASTLGVFHLVTRFAEAAVQSDASSVRSSWGRSDLTEQAARILDKLPNVPAHDPRLELLHSGAPSDLLVACLWADRAVCCVIFHLDQYAEFTAFWEAWLVDINAQ